MTLSAGDMATSALVTELLFDLMMLLEQNPCTPLEQRLVAIEAGMQTGREVGDNLRVATATVRSGVTCRVLAQARMCELLVIDAIRAAMAGDTSDRTMCRAEEYRCATPGDQYFFPSFQLGD